MNGMHGTSDYLFINLIVVMIENFFFFYLHEIRRILMIHIEYMHYLHVYFSFLSVLLFLIVLLWNFFWGGDRGGG